MSTAALSPTRTIVSNAIMKWIAGSVGTLLIAALSWLVAHDRMNVDRQLLEDRAEIVALRKHLEQNDRQLEVVLAVVTRTENSVNTLIAMHMKGGGKQK